MAQAGLGYPMAVASRSEETFSLACRDSYARNNTAKVLTCEAAGEKELPATAVGDALERLKAMDKRWKVTLSESVFYPIGGGQPSDCGWVGTACCEFVEAAEGAMVHWCSAALDVGAEVEVKIDWDKRWYHMQHHTGQHVLSAVAYDLWKAPTNSWDLAADICHVDLGMSQPPKADAVAELEAMINANLRQAKEVRIVPVLGDDADGELSRLATHPLSRGSAPAAGKFPVIRFVEIIDLDFNPCGGTHVRSIGELQTFKVAAVSKDRGNVRLSFVCGSKLIERFTDMLFVEAALTKQLTCKPSEMPGIVEKRLKELKEKTKQKKNLEFELASHIAQGFACEGFVKYHWSDVELPSLQKIAATYTGSAVLWLTCGSELQPKGEGSFLLTGDQKIVDNMVKAAGDEVRELIRGKGGGAKGKWQGKAETMEHREKADTILDQAYAAAATLS